MRDKNLTLSQFNIQLEKALKSSILLDDKFLTGPVFVSPTRCLDNSKVSVEYPQDYRLLRILSISQWFFPEELHWRIYLDLTEKKHSQLNEKQKLEISILLSSKENCVTYLFQTERYSPGELFGNILGNDLRDLEKSLKFRRVYLRKPKKAIRRRGYKDKGSRRPDHQWLPKSDIYLTELQLKKEKKSNLLLKTLHRILLIIENDYKILSEDELSQRKR